MSALSDLTAAVTTMHGCDCVHSGSASVHEVMDGQTVWQGGVEIFTLSGHPKAEQVFAWSYTGSDGAAKYVAVLRTPPVDTPRDAVQLAIASGQIE